MEAARRAGSTVINVRRAADASRARRVKYYIVCARAFISVKYPHHQTVRLEAKTNKICGLHLLPSDSFLIFDSNYLFAGSRGINRRNQVQRFRNKSPGVRRERAGTIAITKFNYSGMSTRLILLYILTKLYTLLGNRFISQFYSQRRSSFCTGFFYLQSFLFIADNIR